MTPRGPCHPDGVSPRALAATSLRQQAAELRLFPAPGFGAFRMWGRARGCGLRKRACNFPAPRSAGALAAGPAREATLHFQRAAVPPASGAESRPHPEDHFPRAARFNPATTPFIHSTLLRVFSSVPLHSMETTPSQPVSWR